MTSDPFHHIRDRAKFYAAIDAIHATLDLIESRAYQDWAASADSTEPEGTLGAYYDHPTTLSLCAAIESLANLRLALQAAPHPTPEQQLDDWEDDITRSDASETYAESIHAWQPGDVIDADDPHLAPWDPDA